MGPSQKLWLRRPKQRQSVLTGKFRLLGSTDYDVTKDKNVHIGPKKAIESFFRPADDWLVLVERGIENHRHPGRFAEVLDQLVIERVGVAIDSLQPA